MDNLGVQKTCRRLSPLHALRAARYVELSPKDSLHVNGLSLVSGVGVAYEFSRYTPVDEVWPVVADHWIIADCAFTILCVFMCFSAL